MIAIVTHHPTLTGAVYRTTAKEVSILRIIILMFDATYKTILQSTNHLFWGAVFKSLKQLFATALEPTKRESVFAVCDESESVELQKAVGGAVAHSRGVCTYNISPSVPCFTCDMEID
jgi:hypothetical protein